MIVGGVAIILATLLAEFHLPLRTDIGLILRIPDILLFGNWAAILIAIVFIGAYSHRVSSEVQSMSEALSATHMALAREQKLTDLGGVVAAAAHELGTPLATIKLTSSELIEELDDRPDLKEDAALIREQADRCRDILRDMGRAGKDDLHLRQAPIRPWCMRPRNRISSAARWFTSPKARHRMGMCSSPRSCANPRSFMACAT